MLSKRPENQLKGPSDADRVVPNPRLDSSDRAIITVLGLLVLVFMAAFANISILIALIGSLAFTVLVQIYGRLPRHDFQSDAERKANRVREANVFGERAIAESLPDGIWIINPTGQIIYANAAADKIWTKTTPGQRLTTLIRSTAVQRGVKDAQAGQSVAPISYHVDTPTDLHLQIFISPLQPAGEDDPRHRHALIVFRDETVLKKTTAMQGDFLANASHELKTPIASLLGYIETLRGHAKNDAKAREKFLVIMQEQAERMQRLISDLLSLRQIEQVEHIAPTRKADIAQAAQRALDAVSPLAAKRGVALHWTPHDPLYVIGNADELTQLCVNIIDNAVKMSPKGATIHIALDHVPQWRPQAFQLSKQAQPTARTRMIITPPVTERAYAVLRISDAGPGLSPDHLPRIGERFYRVAGDRNSREKGTGLGLAIVKHIVMRHRGGLHVKTQSAPEVGRLGDIATSAPRDDKATPAVIKTGTEFTALIPLYVPTDR